MSWFKKREKEKLYAVAVPLSICLRLFVNLFSLCCIFLVAGLWVTPLACLSVVLAWRFLFDDGLFLAHEDDELINKSWIEFRDRWLRK